jgi:hypothetical protein
MQLPGLSSLLFRLRYRARAFAARGDPHSRLEPLELRYDEWPEDSSVPLEGRRTVLPANFRFGPSAAKSVTLRPDRALKLTSVTGTLWITKDRDSVDYVLSPGQSMQCADARSVVVLARFGLLLVEPAATA